MVEEFFYSIDQYELKVKIVFLYSFFVGTDSSMEMKAFLSRFY